MNNAKANVIIAMKMCGMEAISEGGMYHALFSQGLGTDEATMVVKELLEEGRVTRSGCAFILNRYVRPHGEENPARAWAVCNS
jgi:hypothetical protein